MPLGLTLQHSSFLAKTKKVILDPRVGLGNITCLTMILLHSNFKLHIVCFSLVLKALFNIALLKAAFLKGFFNEIS